MHNSTVVVGELLNISGQPLDAQTEDALKTVKNLTDGIVAPLTSAKLQLHLILGLI
jgi:hypothetical protein